MNIWIVLRWDGMFLARDDIELFYTDNMRDAKLFQSYEHAKDNSCPQSENPVRLSDMLNDWSNYLRRK